MVVFVGDCTFKNPMLKNVNYPRGYLRYIKSKNEIKLTDSEVEEVVRKMEAGWFERSIKTVLKDTQNIHHREFWLKMVPIMQVICDFWIGQKRVLEDEFIGLKSGFTT